MKRKFTKILIEWKNSNTNMPFMLVGARQVGKTYIIQDFCQNNYEHYIYINFERDEKYQNIFNDTLDPEIIIEKLSILSGKKIDASKTIIFFDEIQVSERAITSLKYFSESKNKYNIICAGSLLGVALNRFKSSFPVGKVIIEYLYPMDFEEFLWATGNEMLADKIRLAFKTNKQLDEVYHDLALGLFRQFLIIGGLPNIIINYINNSNKISSLNSTLKENIITSYIADMSKYTTASESMKVKEIYLSLPEQLGRDNKKFIYTSVKEGARSDRYKSSISWLIDSHLVLKSNKVKIPQIPLRAFEETTSFKLYLNDTGLLCALANIPIESILFDDLSTFKGMLIENYVAINLNRNKHDLFFWESDAKAEVDFLIVNENNIIPLEVKSSTNTRSRSLGIYRDKYNPRWCYRVSTKNFGNVGDIQSIPIYAIHLI